MDTDEIQAQIDALEIEHAEAEAEGDAELVADIASELGALRELLEEGDEPEVADEEEVAEEEAIEEIEEVAPIEVPPEEEEETEEVEEEMEEELVRDETALGSEMVEIIERWNATVTGDKTGDIGSRREIINELFGTSIMEELAKMDPTFSTVELEIPLKMAFTMTLFEHMMMLTDGRCMLNSRLAMRRLLHAHLEKLSIASQAHTLLWAIWIILK